MNRLLGQKTGFSVSSTVQSHTKGIWISVKPHPNIPDCTLLAVDTQGVFDPKNPYKHEDLNIFSLALLMSECLVYNIANKVDEEMIQLLEYPFEVV